jgi:hypothetical protein
MDEEMKTMENSDDELREAVEEQLSKVHRQAMLLGFQVAIKSVLDKITAFERTPGTKSNNDHKRLIKDIKRFCEQGLSRKVRADGETEPIDEANTVQN